METGGAGGTSDVLRALLTKAPVFTRCTRVASVWRKEALQWLRHAGQEGFRNLTGTSILKSLAPRFGKQMSNANHVECPDPGRQATITNCVLASCSVASSWECCMGLLRYADIYGWTSAISSSSCAGEWEGALEVLTAACYSRLQPTLVTFNALAGASADLDSSFAFPWLVGLTVLERGQADVSGPLFERVSHGKSICRSEFTQDPTMDLRR